MKSFFTMKRSFQVLVTVLLSMPAVLHAYPGPIEFWTWKYAEDGFFVPLQVSAATDPDGRLRTLFLDDSQPYFYNDGTSHKVNPPVMQSFRAFSDGTVINEYQGLTVNDYINTANRATLASYNAALQPRRTSVYSVRGSDTTFAIGGAYRRLLPAESYGIGRSISHRNHFIGLARRPVVDNAAYDQTDSDTLAIASTPTKQNLDVTLNEARLEVRSVTTTTPDLTLRYSQTTSAGFNSVFLRSLDGTPAGWATDRVFTGGSLAMTSDRRDFYAFVTSYKILSPGGQLVTEARIFRLRTLGNTTDPILGIESITNQLVAESTLAAGTAVSSALAYPSVLVNASDEPEWVAWGNGGANTVHAMKRVAGTTGTAEEMARTIANGYVSGFGGAGGEFATGNGLSTALDRLGRLHFAYRFSNSAVYGREDNGNTFTSWILLGKCSGAPAVTVGPGEYPYVVYRGTKPASPNNFDKLVVVYTTGLEEAYKGDFEDRDKDGRLGLIERAQGTSDGVTESSAIQATLALAPEIIEIAPGERRFAMTFRLHTSAVRQGTTDIWNLADGGDALEIRPADASSPAGPYIASGYTVMDDSISGGARFVKVRGPTPVGPSLPSRFFIFQVRRVLGPP